MRILFIGDIVAKQGRKAVAAVLPDLRKKEKIDLVVGNIENLSHGKGATKERVEELREMGVDILLPEIIFGLSKSLWKVWIMIRLSYVQPIIQRITQVLVSQLQKFHEKKYW